MKRHPHQNEPLGMDGENRARRVARPAIGADLPAIQYVFVNAGLSALSNVSSKSDSQPEPCFYVCESNGQLVAAIHWLAIAPEAEILAVAVDREQRRRGHASFLMHE